jgi:hypothetical protein
MLPIKAPVLPSLAGSQLPGMGNRFVMVKLSVSIPSNARTSRKIIERNALNGGAKPEAARASVVLFNPAYLSELQEIRRDITTYLNDIGLKTNDGHWVVHASRYKSIIEKGVEGEDKYNTSAKKFSAAYEQACADWAHNLGEDYDDKLYPDRDKIERKLGLSGNDKRVGFKLTTTMISEHETGAVVEAEMGLSLTDREREFVASGARAHYQGIVDQAFEQLRAAVEKLAAGDTDKRRVRKATVENTKHIADKIDSLGIDAGGLTDKVRSLANSYSMVAKTTKDGKSLRSQSVNRASAVLADLEALMNDPGDDAA